jgi:hypothetical protein
VHCSCACTVHQNHKEEKNPTEYDRAGIGRKSGYPDIRYRYEKKALGSIGSGETDMNGSSYPISSCWFSMKIKILSDTMMGADAPISPITMDTAAPAAASMSSFPETGLAPPCRKEVLRQRSPRRGDSDDFQGLGVNVSSCWFSQRKKERPLYRKDQENKGDRYQ